MTKPLIVRVSPDECYYWINEKRELCIAMRVRTVSALGRGFGREFVLSLILDGPPAGSARYYRVGRYAVRARDRAGYSHTRSASLAGIACVWDYGRCKLRGRSRFTAKQQSYSVLTGWGGDRKVLFVCEFTAVENWRRGERILNRTEEDGMKRPPRRGKPIRIQGPPPGREDDEVRDHRHGSKAGAPCPATRVRMSVSELVALIDR